MEDQFSTYRLFFNAILGPIFSVLGIVGNLTCLLTIVYKNYRAKHYRDSNGTTTTQRHMLGYMYIFICGLALADLCYLAFNLQNCYFGSSWDRLDDHREYVIGIMQPFWNGFKAASDYIVICMTIDRNRIVGAMAMGGVNLQSTSAKNEKNLYAYLQIIGAFVISFVLHIPYYFKVGDYAHASYNSTNDTTLHLIPHNASTLEDLWWIYMIIYAFLVKTLPIIIVVILNSLLIKRLRIVWSRRRQIRGHVTHHVQITLRIKSAVCLHFLKNKS